MTQLFADILAHLPAFLAVAVSVNAALSAVSKSLEVLMTYLSGQPRVVVSEVDGFLLKSIAVIQASVDWLAPRTASPAQPVQPPAA